MKRNLLIAAVMIITMVSCEKEIKTIQPPLEKLSTEVIVSPPICLGNSWTGAGAYPVRGISFTYNNKIYVPDAATQQVHIFDGTRWTSINSDVPIYTSGEWNMNNVDLIWLTIGNKGYLSLTYTPSGHDFGFWEYNITTNAWRRRAYFPGPRRDDPACFTVNGKGYVAGGFRSEEDPNNPNASIYLSDTWEYDPSNNTWTQKANFGFEGRGAATGFNIGSKGYVVGGSHQDVLKQLLEYDPATNQWTKKAPLPGDARAHAATFVIGNKGYVGGGENNGPLVDFYQYDPAANSWTRIADIQSLILIHPFYGFSINSTGYCVIEMNGDNYLRKYLPPCAP